MDPNKEIRLPELIPVTMNIPINSAFETVKFYIIKKTYSSKPILWFHMKTLSKILTNVEDEDTSGLTVRDGSIKTCIELLHSSSTFIDVGDNDKFIKDLSVMYYLMVISPQDQSLLERTKFVQDFIDKYINSVACLPEKNVMLRIPLTINIGDVVCGSDC